MHPFRQAVEAHDLDAFPALLAEDVTFLSPVAFAPYHSRTLVAAILRGADRAFEDFHYIREINNPDGCDHVLVFKAESALARSTDAICCTTTTTGSSASSASWCDRYRPPTPSRRR
jgi:hypothetical protein